MKKRNIVFLATMIFAAAAHAQTTSPAPYCAAGYDDGSPAMPMHYISNVTLGTLTNATGTTLATAPHYTYFNNLAAPKLVKGSSYSLSVSHDPQPTTIHFVAVYIDYNHNNSFTDAGERVLQQSPGNVVNPSVTNITIPATAVTGITRMRVMVFEDDMYTLGGTANATPCTADATGSLDWGETEDYNVNIATSSSGISTIGNTPDLVIYPNPAKDQLFVTDAFAGAVMCITDAQGRLVQSGKISSKAIDISTLTPGMYFISITKDEEVYRELLLVEK